MADAVIPSFASRYPVVDDLGLPYRPDDLLQRAIDQFIAAKVQSGATRHRTIGQLVAEFQALLGADLRAKPRNHMRM